MEKETEKYIAYVRGLYEEAEHDRKAIASAGPVTYHLQLVHGCNRGTSLRSMIYDWYQYDLGVKRIIPGDNPGDYSTGAEGAFIDEDYGKRLLGR